MTTETETTTEAVEAKPKRTTRQRASAAGAKVPADKAMKAEATGGIVTVDIDVEVNDEVREFTIDVDPDDIDDYEAIELLAQNVPTAMFSLICGERESEIRDELRVKEGARAGKLRASSIMAFTMKVMQAVGQGK